MSPKCKLSFLGNLFAYQARGLVSWGWSHSHRTPAFPQCECGGGEARGSSSSRHPGTPPSGQNPSTSIPLPACRSSSTQCFFRRDSPAVRAGLQRPLCSPISFHLPVCGHWSNNDMFITGPIIKGGSETSVEKSGRSTFQVQNTLFFLLLLYHHIPTLCCSHPSNIIFLTWPIKGKELPPKSEGTSHSSTVNQEESQGCTMTTAALWPDLGTRVAEHKHVDLVLGNKTHTGLNPHVFWAGYPKRAVLCRPGWMMKAEPPALGWCCPEGLPGPAVTIMSGFLWQDQYTHVEGP